jgi:aromatic-L-amino-acid decarboxylase
MNKTNDKLSAEETLDPHDWEGLKALGNNMVNEMIGFLQNIKQLPVWKKPPSEVKEKFKQKVPVSSRPFEEIYDEFKNDILPYYIGNIHPRFWGWVMGTGTAQSMLAEMLAAGMNCNVGIGDQSPMYVDQQVVGWCKEMMGFPSSGSGMLVSGASVANLNALITARNAFDDTIRKQGLPSKKMVIYASVEAHSCIQKAAEIIGIGSDGVRKINVNDKYQMDTGHLEQMIEKDKAEDRLPFCIVVSVGTINTGAIDPLEKIVPICRKHHMWMHIDGAFGALLKLLPEYKEQLSCLELADSIAFDLHKWMSIPYEAGVVLIKDAARHRKTFALQPDYISNQERGIAAGPELTSNFGFELTRNFKALKVWMSFQEHGLDKFTRIIRQNIGQSNYLATLIIQHDQLELMAPVSTNIVCFRFNPGIAEERLNELNKEILMQIQEEGIAAPSYTKLNGRYCLRVANVNHRSVLQDFDLLVKEVTRIGTEIMKKEALEIM